MSYEVGQFYDTPTIPIGTPMPYKGSDTLTLTGWYGFEGDLPILTNWAVDESELNGATVGFHVHIDWRFIDPDQYGKFDFLAGVRLQRVMTMPHTEFVPYLQPVTKPLRCWRPMPDLHFEATAPALEKAFACAALQAGRCPHRGTNEAAMVRVGNALVCPAHGLRWHARTKKLVPRSAT